VRDLVRDAALAGAEVDVEQRCKQGEGGAEGEGEGDQPELPSGDAGSLPDEPEVLPDVPDVPPSASGESEPEKS
jgi:hypothetical protein